MRAARSGSARSVKARRCFSRSSTLAIIASGPELVAECVRFICYEIAHCTEREGGLGIGLTIVRGLAELHGGRVAVTSGGFGRGAEFVVALPAEAPAPKRAAAPTPVVHEKPRSHGGCLLSKTTGAFAGYGRVMEKMGHEVRAAADGPEALLVVREYNPEVVLLDMGCPAWMDTKWRAACVARWATMLRCWWP